MPQEEGLLGSPWVVEVDSVFFALSTPSQSEGAEGAKNAGRPGNRVFQGAFVLSAAPCVNVCGNAENGQNRIHGEKPEGPRKEKKTMRRLMMCLGVVAFVASPAMAGVSLTEIPAFAEDGTSYGQCLTPDGKYIGGWSDSKGFVWDAVNGIRQPWGGSYMTNVSGIAYRNPVGCPQELLVFGYDAGWPAMNASTDGGLTWSKRRKTNWPSSRGVNIGANGTMQSIGDDTAYAACWSKDSDAQMGIIKMWGCPWQYQGDTKGTPRGKKACMYGVSGTGLAAGRRLGATGYRNYKCQYEGDGGLSCAFFYGLHPTKVLDGTAWSVARDGSKIGGVSPVGDGRPGNWPYLSDGTPGGAVELPTYSDTGGSSSNAWVYGVGPNGDLACGHNYRGMEKAVYWDASDADPANWTITDLTELCDDAGALGRFTYNLRRAYGISVDESNGDILIVGRGVINDPVRYRGFLLRICEPLALAADILPNDDPNDFVVQKKTPGKSRLPIEVYGSAEFDVADVDLDSVKVAGVSPVKISNDQDMNNDGYADLVIHVNRRELIDALSLVDDGVPVDVVITGAAAGGCPCFEATDVVVPQPTED